MDLTSRHSGLANHASGRKASATILFALVFVAWVGEAPIQFDTALYYGNWRSPFVALGWMFAPLPVISFSPFQLMIGILLPLSVGAVTKRLHAPEMDRAIFISFACIGATVLWGLLMGGSAYFAYYQIWRFAIALMIGYMLMSVVRNERDLILLGKIAVLSGFIRAVICIYYYHAYLAAQEDPTREYVTNHDDSMLFVLAIQISLIWALFKGGKATWLVAIGVSCCVLYAIVLNDRRIAWVELVLGLPAMYMLIGPGQLRRRVTRWAAIAAIPVVAYVGAGMVSNNPVFAPVHAFTSAGSYEDASSLAREEEIRNLLRTLDEWGNPVFGTGWGRPYAMVERAYNNYDEAWILAPYTPHNSMVGLAAYSGLIGILGIWGVVPMGAWLAARGYRNAAGSKVVQTAAMASVGALCSYGIHCYGDIGLQSFPGAVMLGVALAVAGRTAVWNDASTPSGTAAAGRRRVGGNAAGLNQPRRQSRGIAARNWKRT